jgi:hypothetical protein
MNRETPTSAEADVLMADDESTSGVSRRSFLATGAAAGVGASLLGPLGKTATALAQRSGGLTRGDAAILRFLAAAELIEADLWQQYDELGGVNGGNPAYRAALENIDSDMPTYIHLNTEDEQSHAAFLNAYLESKGADPVNLDAFRTLPSSKATGAKQVGRLTSLTSLDVDTSWFTRYRSSSNPDFGATFPQAITIRNQPAIPISDADVPPSTLAPLPPTTPAERRIQAIACTAAFHFGFIESGGTSLYPTLGEKVTDPEVQFVVSSIGPTEAMHFATWQDDAGNAANAPVAPVTDPVTGLTIPNLDENPDAELFQANLIFPHPCEFISSKLPHCAVVRPTLASGGGAVAAVKALTADNLFRGQSAAFFRVVTKLAKEADAARKI